MAGEQGFIQRVRASNWFGACSIIAAVVGFVGSFAGAWIAIDNAQSAKTSENRAKDLLAAATKQAEAAATQAATAASALEEARRQARAAETSVNLAERHLEMLQAQQRREGGARLEAYDWGYAIKPGASPRINWSVRRRGLSDVRNVRFFSNAQVDPVGKTVFNWTQNCSGNLTYKTNFYSDSPWNGSRNSPLSQKEFDDISTGSSVFVLYGKICYDDEFNKDIVLPICAYVIRDRWALCENFPPDH